MTDIGLSQEQIDAMLGGEADTAGGGLSAAAANALSDLERETMANMPSVINAMTGFEYAMGSVEIAPTNAEELPALLGTDVIFSIVLNLEEPVRHCLALDKAFAKSVATALTGGEVGENLELNDMELSAITEVVSQANGSYLTNISSALQTQITGEPAEVRAIEEIAGDFGEGAVVASILISQNEEEPVLVRHVIPGALINLATSKIQEEQAAAPVSPPVAAETAGPEPVAAEPQPELPATSGNVIGPSTEYSPATFSQLPITKSETEPRNLDILMDVPLTVTVELGKTLIPIKQVLEYAQGSLITLDKLAGEPIDLLVNGKYFAKGEVVVIDENFGVRITSILSPAERLSQLG